MRDVMMTAYVLVWPLIVLAMMALMGWGLWRDSRRARRKGEDLV